MTEAAPPAPRELELWASRAQSWAPEASEVEPDSKFSPICTKYQICRPSLKPFHDDFGVGDNLGALPASKSMASVICLWPAELAQNGHLCVRRWAVGEASFKRS